MRIGLMTYADVDNYGDMLFPRIVRDELLKRLPEAEITLFSPTGAAVEEMTFLPYERSSADTRFDAIILTGGDIIHANDEMYRGLYRRLGRSHRTDTPTDLVYDWPTLAAAYKAWIGVGVPSIPSEEMEARVRRAVPLLDRASSRGLMSHNVLADIVPEARNLGIAPDLGWLFPQHVPDHALRWRRIQSRHLPGISSGWYIVFQTIGRLLDHRGVTTAEIAARLVQAQRETGLPVVLLPITRCWDDHATLRDIRDKSDGALALLPGTLTIADTATVLMHAGVYIGSSMHGAVTCLASGIPAAIVYPLPERKFAELFAAQLRLDALRTDWEDMSALARSLLDEPRQLLYLYADWQRGNLQHLFDSVAREIIAKVDAI